MMSSLLRCEMWEGLLRFPKNDYLCGGTHPVRSVIMLKVFKPPQTCEGFFFADFVRILSDFFGRCV